MLTTEEGRLLDLVVNRSADHLELTPELAVRVYLMPAGRVIETREHRPTTELTTIVEFSADSDEAVCYRELIARGGPQ